LARGEFLAAAQRETQRARRTFQGRFLRRSLWLKAPEKEKKNLAASVSPVAPPREIRNRLRERLWGGGRNLAP
jgi:hypothetical protein